MTAHAQPSSPPTPSATLDHPHVDPETAGLRLAGLTHWFVHDKSDVKIVLENVDLYVPARQFVAVVGASGCGKTTILNLVAGLEQPSDGTMEIFVGGEVVKVPNAKVGYMWARDALLPWRSLERNVQFGLEARGVKLADRREISQRYIELVGLKGNEKRFPRQLSQGMRQRGNLARLLATQPEFFLMDEPFSALDAQTKGVMQQEFLNIWQSEPRTTIYVTHDLEEAAALADRVIVMGQGFIYADVQVPFERPRTLTELKFTPGFAEFARSLWDRLQLAKLEGRR